MVPVWVPVDPMQGKTRRGQKVKKQMIHEKSFAKVEIIFFKSKFGKKKLFYFISQHIDLLAPPCNMQNMFQFARQKEMMRPANYAKLVWSANFF
jgi:hypothetical protein